MGNEVRQNFGEHRGNVQRNHHLLVISIMSVFAEHNRGFVLVYGLPRARLYIANIFCR